MIDERHPLLQALCERLEADQQQRLRCQHGEHDPLATASAGVVVCRVCLWCGLALPYGACVVVCSRHVGAVQWQARHFQSLHRSDTSHQERREP